MVGGCQFSTFGTVSKLREDFPFLYISRNLDLKRNDLQKPIKVLAQMPVNLLVAKRNAFSRCVQRIAVKMT